MLKALDSGLLGNQENKKQDGNNSCSPFMPFEQDLQKNEVQFEKMGSLVSQKNKENLEEKGKEHGEAGLKKQWSAEEEEILVHLHNIWGNKWTQISLQLPGKNHNSVKNHFYAQIRKGIRRVNSFLSLYLPESKPLNIAHVSKMITMFSEKAARLEEVEMLLAEHEKTFLQMKQSLFRYSRKSEGEGLEGIERKKLEQFLQQVIGYVNMAKKGLQNGRKQTGRTWQEKSRIQNANKLVREQDQLASANSFKSLKCQNLFVKSQHLQESPQLIRPTPLPLSHSSFPPYFFPIHINFYLPSQVSQVSQGHNIFSPCFPPNICFGLPPHSS